MEVNYLLMGVLFLFLVCLVMGYKKGFLRIAISLVNIVLIIAAVTVVTPYVSNFAINSTGAYDTVKTRIEVLLQDDNEKLDTTTRENQEQTIQSYGLPEVLASALIKNNTTDTYKQYMVSAFEDYISGYLARLAIKAASFIIVFALLGILVWIALRMADLVAKLPVIKGLNKILGIGAGAVQALSITWVFFLIVVMFMGSSFGDSMMKCVEQSSFLTYLFNENVLLELLM